MEEQIQELISVKDYAKAAGITEQAVYKRLKNPNFQKYLVETNGKKLLKAEILETIEEKKTVEQLETENLREMVELLKQQTTMKDEQIKALQMQINAQQQENSKLISTLESTTESLQAAQALHAGTIQKQLTDSEEPKKKGFFNLFKRQKK